MVVETNDRQRVLTHGAQHDNAWMTSRRMHAHISEPAIQGHDQSPVLGRRCEHCDVVFTGEAFVGDGVDVMTTR
jgi:hypothetical protein